MWVKNAINHPPVITIGPMGDIATPLPKGCPACPCLHPAGECGCPAARTDPQEREGLWEDTRGGKLTVSAN